MILNDKKKLALFFASAGWFLVLSGRLTTSTLLLKIEESFGIDHAQAGLALTGMWLSYGVMQFPSGLWSDIRGRKVTILCALGTFSLAFIFMGISMNYGLFFFFLVMLGLGSGCFQTASISMLSDLYLANRGKALGLQASSGSIAGLVPIAVPVLAELYHWRALFIMWGILSLSLAFLFRRYSVETTRLPQGVSIKDRFMDGVSVLKQGTTRLFLAVNLILVFTWMGFMSFFPAYTIENKGLTPFQAGVAFALISFSGILLKPLIGIISDRGRKKPIITALLFITAIAAGGLVFIESFALICVAAFLMAFITSIFLVMNSYLMDYWEERGRGGKLGFYRTITILVGSPTSAFIGYTATRYGFDTPFFVLAVLLMLAAVMLLFNTLFARRRVYNESGDAAAGVDE